MANLIGELFPLAVALATGPLPIIALMLILASDGARAKGLGFVGGRMAGLAVLVGAALVIASAVDDPDPGHRAHPSTVVSIIRISVGVLLVAVAVRMWLRRGIASSGEPSRLARHVDGASPKGAFGLGLAVTAIDPASLSIGVLVGFDIAAARMGTPVDLAFATAFVLMATVNVTVPLLTYLVGGDAARRKLAGLKDWLQTNEKTVMMVLFVMIGAILIGRGIRDLTG